MAGHERCGYAPTVRFACFLFLTLWLILACGPRSTPRGQVPGQMSATWDGSRNGSMAAPASATWCEARRLLEIRSIRGDTGIALALYPGKSLRTGSYPILPPAKAESQPPAAGVAVRWLGPNLVQGFRGDSGQLQLERSNTGQLSGQVQARARSVVDTQRIMLTASFRELTPRPDSLGCTPIDTTDEDLGADDAGGRRDTMVD